MAIIVGCVGQKGGPGKSTTARLLAVGVIKAGSSAAIADLDHTQGTVHDWSRQREKYRAALANKKGRDPNEVPRVPVQPFATVDEALQLAPAFDFYVLDAPGRTGPEITRIAEVSDIVVLPCNPGSDDIVPTMRVFNALVARGFSRRKLIVLLNHVGNASEEVAARKFLEECGAQVLNVCLREKVAYRTAMTAGLSCAEVKPERLRNEAEAVVSALIQLIIEIHGEPNGGLAQPDQSSHGDEAAA